MGVTITNNVTAAVPFGDFGILVVQYLFAGVDAQQYYRQAFMVFFPNNVFIQHILTSISKSPLGV
jgi:hypothetical protein